MRPHKN